MIAVQLLTSVGIAAGFLLQGPWEAMSALCGGLTSISTALLLSRGVKRAGEAALSDPKKSLAILYIGAVQRFLLVMGLLALGLAVFKLEAIAVCVGFAIAQVSYLVSSRETARSK